jgi:hypothetical protein
MTPDMAADPHHPACFKNARRAAKLSFFRSIPIDPPSPLRAPLKERAGHSFQERTILSRHRPSGENFSRFHPNARANFYSTRIYFPLPALVNPPPSPIFPAPGPKSQFFAPQKNLSPHATFLKEPSPGFCLPLAFSARPAGQCLL